MSTCVYEKELYTDINTPESVAYGLREAADKIEAQHEISVEIYIAGITVILDAVKKEISVIA